MQTHAFIALGLLKGTFLVADSLGDIAQATISISSVPAAPVVYTVNTTNNQTDAPGGAIVSLSDAAQMADGYFGPVTIDFDPSVFAKLHTIASDISLGNMYGVITLKDPAAGVIVRGQISILQGTAVNLDGITDTGMGIVNSGTATLADCLIEDVQTLNGGIDNQGTMTLIDSTVTGNTAIDQEKQYMLGSYYIGGGGGGILNYGSLILRLHHFGKHRRIFRRRHLQLGHA